MSPSSRLPSLLALGLTVALSPALHGESASPRKTLLLSINDTYRIEGAFNGEVGGFARVRALRRELEREAPELLVFHAGDLFFPSLLSRTYKGEQMVDGLNHLDGSQDFDERLFVTFGNHEFDKDKCEHAEIVRQRITESRFTWVSSNVCFKSCESGVPAISGTNLVRTKLVTSGGIRIGIFGLTLDDKVPRYADITPFIQAARRATAELREAGAEVIVALTHLEMKQDEAMLRELGADGPDLVLGGHEHIADLRTVDGRPICKADSDAGSACIVELEATPSGSISIHPRPHRSLVRTELAPDPELAALARGWIERHAERFCAEPTSPELAKCLELGRTPPGPSKCLETVLGRTSTPLVAEETRIRAQETSLGNFVADLMLAELAPRGAQVAFINAGSLRLNRDVAAGVTFTRRDLEELFEYETPLRLVRIDGATLQAIVERAVRSWPGHGSWLQIAGFAYRHDTEAGTVRDLTLLSPAGPRPIRPDEEILAATTDFLVNPKVGNRDGYVMLWPCLVEARAGDAKELVCRALVAAEPAGIAPRAEGRICTSEEESACLAVSPAAAAPCAGGTP